MSLFLNKVTPQSSQTLRASSPHLTDRDTGTQRRVERGPELLGVTALVLSSLPPLSSVASSQARYFCFVFFFFFFFKIYFIIIFWLDGVLVAAHQIFHCSLWASL